MLTKNRVAIGIRKICLLVETHHKWIFAIYALIFLGFAIGSKILSEVGHWLTYLIAAISILGFIVLFIFRRINDPVWLPVRENTAGEPLDENDVSKVRVDDVEQINELVELGEEAFATWSSRGPTLRQIVYNKFLQGHPNSFYLMTPQFGEEQPEPVGFSCIFPVTEAAYRNYRLGILDSWDFGPEDFIGFGGGPYQYLCLNAIYLRKAYRKKHAELALRVLMRHLADFIDPRGGVSPVLFAEGLTKRGRIFALRNGFETYYKSRDGFPVFELDLARINVKSDEAIDFKRRLYSVIETYRRINVGG